MGGAGEHWSDVTKLVIFRGPSPTVRACLITLYVQVIVMQYYCLAQIWGKLSRYDKGSREINSSNWVEWQGARVQWIINMSPPLFLCNIWTLSDVIFESPNFTFFFKPSLSVFVVVHVVVIVIPVVNPRNIPLKFGSNQVINRWDVVDAVVVSVVVVVVVIVVVIGVVIDPRNLLLKLV